MTHTRIDRDDDRLHEECGVFGISGHPDAAVMTALGLHALQHRGQEAAGITAFDGTRFYSERRPGLVGEYFTREDVIAHLKGSDAIGHVRYATFGKTGHRNIQPLFADVAHGGIACAHNGHLTNAFTLRRLLVNQGCIFQSTCDTEVILHLAARSRMRDPADCLIEALRQIEGAYALSFLTHNALIGARDPLGIRPLVLGALDGAAVLASETCALDIIGAQYVRDVAPGEMVVIQNGVVTTLHPFPPMRPRPCIFEYVYFARPDSKMGGKSVYEYRKQMGEELAREAPATADMVVPVPDSGVPAALGYARELGVPFELGITRNHYVGRTFIEPTQSIRRLGVRLKHNPNASQIKGKRIALIDDSIVRGTTAEKIVRTLYDFGASEVHMRIACPPVKYPDFYGIDTPEPSELLANRIKEKDWAKELGVDSLSFLSIDGLYRALGHKARDAAHPQFTDHCFTGAYPTPLTDEESADQAEQLSLLSESS